MESGRNGSKAEVNSLPKFVEDSYGHRIEYLRISVTDRCNERCTYCMPDENQQWLDRSEVLSYDEILRVAHAGVSLGISKIRVTGGEPLTRPGVADFMGELGRIPQVQSLGFSSNGTLLARKQKDGSTNAEGLYQAGVRALNLSLDSLDPEVYRDATSRDLLPQFLEGLEAAQQAGFEKIRLNCVLMRHRNEHELWDLVEFAAEKNCLIRFVELMPVSSREVLTEDNFLPAEEARRIIAFRFGELKPLPEFRTNGPSSYYELPSGQRIGFIGAMTNLHFCENCNKLRLTADGKLRPCLGSHLEFDMREVLRDPATTDADLVQFFRDVVAKKPKEHDFRENYQPKRRMIAIGG